MHAFSRVLNSGHVVMGSEHKAFEVELAEYLGSEWVLGVASGTDALELAIKAAMPRGKHTVLTAANAGGYTTTAALRAGFRVCYADVSAESLCVDEETILASLRDDVGVVVITHLYGNLTDIRGLVATCHNLGIRVVEDCAQAIGARSEFGFAGTFADIGTVSFYPTKNLGAIGDGGAIITSSDALAATVRQLRQYGWETKYYVTAGGGVNSRLDEVQASFLRVRLPNLDSLNERRRIVVARYVEAAANGPIRVLPADGPHHVAHIAACLTADRAEIRKDLASMGVQTDVYFPVPDYCQPGFNAEKVNLEVTEITAQQVFSLPCFPELSDVEIDQVCSALRSLSAQTTSFQKNRNLT